jgi:THO complex subunit 2
MAPPKRKRNERGSVDASDGRPSPHRPGNSGLGQRDREADMRGDRRRSSRGGRGGGGGPRTRNNERKYSSDNTNGVPASMQLTPGPMSPPPRPSSATQPQAPVITTLSPASVEETSTLEVKSTRIPYDYFYVTDGRVATWSVAGRQEVVAAGKQAQEDLDTLDLSSIFQELLHATLDRRLDAKDAGDCVRDILGEDTIPLDDASDKVDGPALFADTLSVIADSETFDPVLQNFVVASGVSPVILRQLLDQELLQNLRLTRDTFIKAGIRQVTNLLYRQANHNLLREETEGYSKLVTELFTTSANEPHTGEVVEETFERVKGLIGTFNLDVGRVLDITIDVFAAVLIKQFRFFVKFLRVSSWWPRDSGLHGLAPRHAVEGLPSWAIPGSPLWNTVPDTGKPPLEPTEFIENREERDRSFWARAREIGLDAFSELGGRHPVDDEIRKAIVSNESDADMETSIDRQWIEATGTLPPSGSRVAAQLLGFKLRFYSSEARDQDDVLPANLIFLSALLIKIGFISLRDLYPHLWPLDEDMEAVRVAKMKEIAEKERLNRPGATKNALMTAGALMDDTLPNNGRVREAAPAKPDPAIIVPMDEAEGKEKLPEPQDQKVQLLIHLLTIGAIPESLFILGRFPWLPEAFPEIYDLIHRILHHSITKVYEDSQIPNISAEECPAVKYADLDQTSAPKGHVRRTQFVPRKQLRWPHADKYDQNEGNSYRFYWDEWADDIPVCQTVEDIFTLCSTLLNFSGVNIGRDAALLSKLATIGTKSLSQDCSEANLARWQDLLRRLLVPALSLSKSNISLANEIYDMLRYYPGPIRFSIYAEWFEGQTSRIPAMVSAFTRTRLETLSTMKRISKTNITAMARTLAKTAYASPGIVFKVALDQIEAYSNLTEVVVECAKYFTDLGYDVLIWSLMSALGGKSRSRTRQDAALLTSRWLIALSKFSGSVFRRYSIMNPAPILQYVNDQLSRGNSTDLIILEELIAQMSGVVSDIDFTDSQLSAMTGGEILRRQTLISLQDKRFESIKTAKRLMRSLTETRLAGQLLISIAQHRQSAIYAVPDDEAHIKLLSTLIDETQRILSQYLDLLRSNLSVEQFDTLVPSTGELMTDFGLDPSLAFLIGRSSFAHRLAALKLLPWKDTSKDHATANGTTSRQDSDGDTKTNSAESPKVDEASEGAISSHSGEAVTDGSSDGNLVVVQSPPSVESWHEVLKPLVDAVQSALPKQTWRLLNPEFYVVFWQLSLADITLPMDSYGAESQRLQREMTELMRDTTRPGMARRDEARRALEATIGELLKESKQEVIKYEGVRARLNKEKAHWFKNVHPDYEDLCDVILEECVLPRVLLSPSDADYSFRMIKFLHNNGTPNFRTLALYVRLFRSNRLRALIFSCTIREADNLGRFLKLILKDLSSWHASKTTYEKEALGTNRDLPGFAKSNIADGKPAGLLEFEEFRRVFFTFHKNLNTALKSCLGGTEYMQIRNAISVLKGTVEYFPAIDFMGKYYKGALSLIAEREKDKRGDLSLTASSLLPDLKKRESRWVMPQAFATHLVCSTHSLF